MQSQQTAANAQISGGDSTSRLMQQGQKVLHRVKVTANISSLKSRKFHCLPGIFDTVFAPNNLGKAFPSPQTTLKKISHRKKVQNIDLPTLVKKGAADSSGVAKLKLPVNTVSKE